MRKIFVAACVVCAAASACPAQTLEPVTDPKLIEHLNREFGNSDRDDNAMPWVKVRANMIVAQISWCLATSRLLSDMTEMSNADLKDLGVASFEEALDLADELFKFIDRHCDFGVQEDVP